ncbi:hypothetical protein ACFVFS_34625 [Kitasatospora sp. NPDC057692]|uniref:hypothetical protein n=1 Tax=Kitasatospora sp. NPDC057692 TaxID=3346215 RepID=UPI0036B9CBD1
MAHPQPGPARTAASHRVRDNGPEADLDQITDELHTLTPDDFTTARNRQADELKKTDRPLAARIRAQRRPTQAAWAANQLALHHRDLVADLLGPGQELRAAQEQLASERRRQPAAPP